MSDTTTQECIECGFETDCIEGICLECRLKQDACEDIMTKRREAGRKLGIPERIPK